MVERCSSEAPALASRRRRRYDAAPAIERALRSARPAWRASYIMQIGEKWMRHTWMLTGSGPIAPLCVCHLTCTTDLLWRRPAPPSLCGSLFSAWALGDT